MTETPMNQGKQNSKEVANDSAASTDQPESVTDTSTQPLLTDSNKPKEHGGTKGLEPTRYGDWEHKGRCTDF